MGAINVKGKNAEEMTRKIVVIGDEGSGKTCLVTRFVENLEPKEREPSAVQVLEKKVVERNMKVHLFIYDIGGHEAFRHLREINYPRSDAAIICFSIDKPNHFEKVKEAWVEEIERVCPGIPLLLVGNKRDLRDQSKTIDGFVRQSHGHTMADKAKMDSYLECSAENGDGIEEVFKTVAKIVAGKKI